MAPIKWDDSYDVGVKQFNNDHQKLFGYLDQLFDALKEGKAKELAPPIIQGLAQYTVTHFRAEEAMMSVHKYPNLAAHKQAHASFEAKVKELEQSLANVTASVAINMNSFLTRWLTDHIKKVDREYTVFFKEKGIS